MLIRFQSLFRFISSSLVFNPDFYMFFLNAMALILTLQF